MKYPSKLIVLAVMVFFLPFQHLELESSDDSWLLLVDGRPVDVVGYFSEQFTSLTRRCNQVEMVIPGDPLQEQALNAIRQYSPPDSFSAQILQLTRQHDWLLAQVKFDQLESAVVLLTQLDQKYSIPTGGVWSGSTHPHRPEPFVRRFIRANVPLVPAQLMSCFEYASVKQ